uniref:Putative reverse transcriptase domain-containing protein n=1 Tax=Tanacetum cinerariifolium TaxID=118510 RepID=A0A6L2JQX3_TANCI|nr:putative reverse transcriptase domain-containing protein [Tanacetum cinerariifolium]
MLLVQLQEAGIQLSKDQLATLADTRERIDFGPGAFTVTTNALFQADGVEVYDSDYDDVTNSQPSFMANISSHGFDVLAEVQNPDNMDNNMINQGKANVMADVLSRKERIEPLRVRALVMTIGLDIPKQILEAQSEAQKPENLVHEDKGVVRFDKRGKLNPRYVRPFKVLAKVRKVAYRLELSQELIRVHHTFHESNLKKCYTDEPLVMPLEGIHIDDKLQFLEEPIEIME